MAITATISSETTNLFGGQQLLVTSAVDGLYTSQYGAGYQGFQEATWSDYTNLTVDSVSAKMASTYPNTTSARIDSEPLTGNFRVTGRVKLAKIGVYGTFIFPVRIGNDTSAEWVSVRLDSSNTNASITVNGGLTNVTLSEIPALNSYVDYTLEVVNNAISASFTVYNNLDQNIGGGSVTGTKSASVYHVYLLSYQENDVEMTSLLIEGVVVYEWRLGGNKIWDEEDPTYTVTNVTNDDAGSYTLYVTDGISNDLSNSITVTVDAITANVSPTSASGSALFSQLLTCSASGGAGSNTYQWKQNNVNIAGATSSTYQISDGNFYDSGLYTCGVSDIYDTVESNACNVTITGFATQELVCSITPTSKKMGVGLSHTITSSTSGGEPQNSSGANCPTGKTYIDTTLTTTPLSVPLTSGFFYLNIGAIQAWIGAPTPTPEIYIHAIPFYPTSGYIWYMNAVAYQTTTDIETPWGVLADTNMVNGSGSSTARLEYRNTAIYGSINTTDGTLIGSGTTDIYWDDVFKGTISGSFNRSFSGPITASIESITNTKNNPTYYLIGSGLGSSCSGDQFVYTYQWYDGVGAIPGETSSSITFNPTAESDSDTYYVNADDGSGNVNSNNSTLLVVTLAASVDPTTITENTPYTVNITCTAVGGTEEYTYQWKKDTIDISGETNSTLTITDALDSDDGSYTCVVNDGLQSVTSDACVVDITNVLRLLLEADETVGKRLLKPTFTGRYDYY